MDDAIERQQRQVEDQRREAVRSAQRSDTNVYLFRRLKWGWPALSVRRGNVRGLRIIDILLVVVIVSLLGLSGLALLGL